MGKRGPKAKEVEPEVESNAVPEGVEQVEVPQETSATEQQAPAAETAEKIAAPSFPSDRWIYSEDKEPMILKAGTPLPDGFTTDRKAIKAVWENTATGKWVKK